MCQRWSGGSFMAVACEDVRIEPTESLATYVSSEWAERQFCRSCGSSLFWRMRGHEGHIYVSALSFEDQDQLNLESEIFIDEKPSWYDFSGDRPRLTGAEVVASANAGKE
jgi:hypothetical protein